MFSLINIFRTCVRIWQPTMTLVRIWLFIGSPPFISPSPVILWPCMLILMYYKCSFLHFSFISWLPPREKITAITSFKWVTLLLLTPFCGHKAISLSFTLCHFSYKQLHYSAAYSVLWNTTNTFPPIWPFQVWVYYIVIIMLKAKVVIYKNDECKSVSLDVDSEFNGLTAGSCFGIKQMKLSKMLRIWQYCVVTKFHIRIMLCFDALLSLTPLTHTQTHTCAHTHWKLSWLTCLLLPHSVCFHIPEQQQQQQQFLQLVHASFETPLGGVQVPVKLVISSKHCLGVHQTLFPH